MEYKEGVKKLINFFETHGWVRRLMASKDGVRECRIHDEGASCFCVVGAMAKLDLMPFYDQIIEDFKIQLNNDWCALTSQNDKNVKSKEHLIQILSNIYNDVN